MSDLAKKEAQEERPAILTRAAHKFQERPAFYLGWIAVLLIAIIGVQLAASVDSGSTANAAVANKAARKTSAKRLI